MRTEVIGLNSAPSKRLLDLLSAGCDQICLNCWFANFLNTFDDYCSLVKECSWAVTDYYCPRIVHLLASINLEWFPLQASLPLAKLCAMVTMQSITGPNLQSFSLPLKLVSEGKKVWLTETSVHHSIYYSFALVHSSAVCCRLAHCYWRGIRGRSEGRVERQRW